MADKTRRMGDSQGCGTESSQQYWAEFVERHYEEVRCRIARQVRNPHDVDDLVQEVFVSVLMHAGGLREPHAYMRAVIKHTLYAHWRRRKRGLLAHRIVLEPDGDAPVAYQDRHSDPLEQLLHREMRQILSSMMACLSPGQAQALRLRFIDGLHLGEAALQAGCSHETLKKRLLRARQSLAPLCGEDW